LYICFHRPRTVHAGFTEVRLLCNGNAGPSKLFMPVYNPDPTTMLDEFITARPRLAGPPEVVY